MSPFHNRTGIVTLAVAAVVLLLGAGCQKAQENRSPILDQGASTLPSATNDASVSLPTKWAEYRSEALGITIPYPEGWYVEEDVESSLIKLYEAPPPEESDMPTDLLVQCHGERLASVVGRLGTALEDEQVERGGRPMRRMVFETDYSDERGRLEMYIWEQGERTCRASGVVGSPHLNYLVENLEVQQ